MVFIIDSSDSEYGDNLNRIRESFLNGDFPKHIWRTQPDAELINPVVKTLTAAALRNLAGWSPGRAFHFFP